ncbi:MAG: hypothetical protein GF344_02700 [Chitinivibrionales bacterium]|nr:hypothetical protein [Chitinivibrionales bacterium]MBD3355992.1 hypothetical protein [Chitinivibrionales bacterium]
MNEMDTRKTLLFAAAGYNLAETSRMLEIAKASKDNFNILFICYGGKYEHLIEESGFALQKMEPRITKERMKHIYRGLRGESLNTVNYFPYKEIRQRVAGELDLLGRVKPAAVLTGWVLSIALSARIAKTPFVNVLHSTTIREFYKANLQPLPGRTAVLAKILPQKVLVSLINTLILHSGPIVRPYNKIAAKHSMRKFHDFIDFIEGDHVLLADIPEFANLPEIRPHLHFVGPLYAKIDLPVPEDVAKIPKDKPIVYCAMGSSGSPKLLKEIIQGFAHKPYRVIAPVKGITEEENVDVPDNVIVTEFVPAHKVNPMADISVIHGGQNTVMQACISGTPIVGIGMHAEQEANLETCVRKGFAIHFNRYFVKATDIIGAIDTLLHDQKAKEAIAEFRTQLKKWHGPENAAAFLKDHFA